jgi:hypothetical protein
MKKIDLTYYLFLIIILAGGVGFIILLSPNKNLQFFAASGLSILYGAYGIIHHRLAHSLVGKIVVEYILVAMLGIAISFFILRGGFGF